MTLKQCPCCKTLKTTKNSKRVGRQVFGAIELLYLNCKECGSTFVLKIDTKKVK